MKAKYLRFTIIAVTLLSISLLNGCSYSKSSDAHNPAKADSMEVTMYKSPNCGCCVQHKAYLEENGFKVKVEMTEDMEAIKEKYNIPREMQSCHTIAMGDYFVEGHMPIEAIQKLMSEKPDIDGIALPGMPSGSPGMPGPKTGPFRIYQLADNEQTVYINL